MIENYVIEWTNLKWDREGIVDIMRTHPDHRWINEPHGRIPGRKYINKYLRVETNDLFQEIYNQYPDLELKPEFTFFMELSPDVLLAPHTDAGRGAAINFPLIGDWSQTPVRFHKNPTLKKEDIVYEHYYNPNHPSIINVSNLHSVWNNTKETRYMLSISVHKSWEEIQEIVQA